MAKKRKLKKPDMDFSKVGLVFKYNVTKFIVPLVLVLIVGILIFAFIEGFKVKTVTVEGSSHYTTDEITNYVLDSKLCMNTVFLNLKYKRKPIKDIPFVERIDVKIVDRNSVKITVFEKYVAGCIANLGNYMYFDNDGTIVEVSKIKTENVPVVTGLSFDHFNLYEPLPIGSDMDEKFNALTLILPELKGQKGVLHMENYTEANSNVVFNIDDEEESLLVDEVKDTPGITLVE